MTELTIDHPTFGSMTSAEIAEMTREAMNAPAVFCAAKLTHALALMIQRLDELRRDQFDETTKAAMVRAKVDGAETVAQFADRMAHHFTQMAAETECDRPTFSMTMRDAARLLREEVGL